MFKRSLVSAALAALLVAAAPSVFAAGIDLNSANAETLQRLDGVGESRSQAIVEYREANGGFDSVAELTKVDGIGEHTLESNRDRLRVE